jgi:hypothetical protein
VNGWLQKLSSSKWFVLLLTLLVVAPALQPSYAAGTTSEAAQLKRLVEDCLAQSKTFFGTRKYQAGASQVEDAARIVRSMPHEFPQYNSADLVSTAVDFLNNEYEVAEEHGNRQASYNAVTAEVGLLRTLCVWEPTNSKWSQMRLECQKFVDSKADENEFLALHPNLSIDSAPYRLAGRTSKNTPALDSNTEPESPDIDLTQGSKSRLGWTSRSQTGWGLKNIFGISCPRCGHHLWKGATYCSNCGAMVKQ